MNWKLVANSVASHVAESTSVLVLGFMLPLTLLLRSWNQPLLKVWQIVPLSSEIDTLGEVILVIVPIASIYFASGTVFAFHLGRRGAISINRFFSFLFFIPIVALVYCQLALTSYYPLTKTGHLEDRFFGECAGIIYATVLLLLWLEIYMSIMRSAMGKSESGVQVSTALSA